MSLINDVLRDLESRGEARDGRPPNPGGTRARPARRWVWWLAAAVIAGFLLHWVTAGFLPGPEPAREMAAAAPDPAPPDPVTDELPPLLQPLPRVAAAGQEPESRAGTATSDVTADPDEGSDDPGAGERDAGAAPATPQPPGPAGHDAPEPESRPIGPGAAEPASLGVDATTFAAADRVSGSRPEDTPSIVIRRSGDTRERGEVDFSAARRALARGNNGLAASRLQELIDADPGHTEARLLLSRVHLAEERPRTAARLLEEGLQRDPGESRLAFMLGRLLLDQGRVASALEILDRHAPPIPRDADYHLLRAAAHRQAGDHGRAATVYRELTGAHPSLGAAWVGLGVSLESVGRTAEARTAYDRALGGDDRRAAAFARQRLAVMPNNPDSGTD